MLHPPSSRVGYEQCWLHHGPPQKKSGHVTRKEAEHVFIGPRYWSGIRRRFAPADEGIRENRFESPLPARSSLRLKAPVNEQRQPEMLLHAFGRHRRSRQTSPRRKSPPRASGHILLVGETLHPASRSRNRYRPSCIAPAAAFAHPEYGYGSARSMRLRLRRPRNNIAVPSFILTGAPFIQEFHENSAKARSVRACASR